MGLPAESRHDSGGMGERVCGSCGSRDLVSIAMVVDGQHLVFGDNADRFTKSANIATVAPDGTDLTYLTHFHNPTHRAYVGGYSPNGRWIAVSVTGLDPNVGAVYIGLYDRSTPFPQEGKHLENKVARVGGLAFEDADLAGRVGGGRYDR